MTQLDS